MKHHFLRTGRNDVDSELELVRKGFDPSQVQQLVGQLSAELKTMAAENDRLRGRMAELEAAPPPPPAPGAGSADIFAHWSKETNDLLDAARASISSVTEKATTDAAAAVAAGETAANAIRQRAQLDAEGVMADARQQAERTLADAEQQKGEVEAEAAATKARLESEAQASLDRSSAQLADLERKLSDLRGQPRR